MLKIQMVQQITVSNTILCPAITVSNTILCPAITVPINDFNNHFWSCRHDAVVSCCSRPNPFLNQV